MVKCYRKAFAASDLWVTSNEQLSDFYASSWQKGDSPIPLLMIRLILMMIAILILVWSMVEARSAYWLVFLTNWGFLLITLTMISGTFVSLNACKLRYEQEGSTLPWFVSVYWFLFNCSISVSLLITLLYFVLLYDPETFLIDARIFWLDMATHAMNSFIAIVELVSSRTPIRLLHIYQPLGIGLWYTLFSYLYFAFGGTDAEGNPFIYDILDWRETPRSVIVIGASMACLIIIYVALWTVGLGRDKLTGSVFRTTSVELPFVPSLNIHINNTLVV